MLIEQFYFYCFYALPLLTLLLYRNAFGPKFLQLGLGSLFILFYIISNHIGLIFLFHAKEGIKQLAAVDKSVVVMMAATTSLVTFAYLIADAMLKNVRPSLRMFSASAIDRRQLRVAPATMIILFSAIIAIVKFLDGSPLLQMLSQSVEAANAQRVANYSNVQDFFGWKLSYIQIIFKVTELLSLIYLVLFLSTKRKRYFLLYCLTISIVILESMSNASKGALVIPIYQIWLLYALINTKGVVVNKFVVWGGVVACIGVSSITAIMLANDNIDWFYPIERLVLGNLIPQYVIMSHFDFDSLLWGATLPSWWTFGNHDQFLLDVFAWKEIMGWQDGQPFYAAPSSLVADSYANFHFIGVFFVILIFFIFLGIIEKLIMRSRSELRYAALFTFAGLHFSYLAVGGSLNFLFDYYFITVWIFSYVLVEVHRGIKGSYP